MHYNAAVHTGVRGPQSANRGSVHWVQFSLCAVDKPLGVRWFLSWILIDAHMRHVHTSSCLDNTARALLHVHCVIYILNVYLYILNILQLQRLGAYMCCPLPACKVYGLCDEGAAFCLMTLDICCTCTCMSDRRSVREDWYQIVAFVVYAYECTMYLAARFFQGNFV